MAGTTIQSTEISMSETILKLLGLKLEQASRLADIDISFHGGIGWGWLILLAAVLGTLAWLSYRWVPEETSRTRKYCLLGLRWGFLALLLLLLLRPVLSLTIENRLRQSLLLLVDESASMGIEDPRTDIADLKRAGMALGLLNATNGLIQEVPAGRAAELDNRARLLLAQAILTNQQYNLLARLEKRFDVIPFGFGNRVRELSQRSERGTNAVTDTAWVAKLRSESSGTAIGEALREVVNQRRGQPLAGVFVVTDGGHNLGLEPRELAAQFRQDKLPLFFYGVGVAAPRDIILTGIGSPEVAFVGDEVLVNVRVRSQGLAGESAEVVLKLNDEKVASEKVELKADGEQVYSLRFTPKKLGDFDLVASIEPRNDEIVKDNNSRQQRLRLVDSRIRVLLVEQSPRWDYRYLQAMFMRDRRIEFKTVLLEGDTTISQIEGSPFLDAFPANREKLFQYDVVIWGDVDPKLIGATQLENLHEFVGRFGGSLVFIAGRNSNPWACRNTPLEKMLPVEFDAVRSASLTADEVTMDKPLRLQLTPAGKASTMLRLADKEERSSEIWAEIPPIYWAAKVTRAKPAAEVLLVDPDPAKATRYGKMPVMASQQYGMGQVLYVGTDNSWRWRKNVGDPLYTTLWGQIVQRMALPRLLGVSKRTQLTLDRQNFQTGERVKVHARLYTAGFEPLLDPVVKAHFQLRDSAVQTEVPLRQVPDQPGIYRGDFIAPASGNYQIQVASDPDVKVGFAVTESRREFTETAMNAGLLRDLASATGGGFFREEDLAGLPDKINPLPVLARSAMEVELWSSMLFFIVIILMVTTEWVLRKLTYLK